jgi:hypothetical protein
MPKASLPKQKTNAKQRKKYEVPDGYDVLTPSPRDDNTSESVKQQQKAYTRSFHSEAIGSNQRVVSRSQAEDQNFVESRKERESSADSQRTLRYNDFELIHRSDAELPLDIEPTDSVSNHGSHVAVSQFPEFTMRNVNRADKRMDGSRAFHNDQEIQFYKKQRADESDRELKSRDLQSGVKSVTTQLASHNLNNQLKALSSRNHEVYNLSHSNSRDNKYSEKERGRNNLSMQPYNRDETYLYTELPRVIEVLPKKKKTSVSPVRHQIERPLKPVFHGAHRQKKALNNSGPYAQNLTKPKLYEPRTLQKGSHHRQTAYYDIEHRSGSLPPAEP